MLNIVFMGTPEFAVPSLDILNINHNISAVVTAPDKPAGRGRKLRQSAVKKYALAHQFKVFQPLKLKDTDFVSTLKSLKPDLIVVVAFRMLPKAVWNIPPLGTINLHASLLPLYRGAAPINHAIINGESRTGLTTFFINEDIDTGKILLQTPVKISKSDTAGSLHDKLMVIGADLILKTVNDIENKSIQPSEQRMVTALKAAPKLLKQDCQINWNDKAENIYNFIRGLSPYPTSWSKIKLKDKIIRLKIYDAEFDVADHQFLPGTVIQSWPDNFAVAVKDGFIKPGTIQPESKTSMSIKDFIQGYDIDNAKFLLPST
ncbi:MAG: methionyl-tRNA formyltransferase [Bacteroidales bacterium]